MGRVAIALPLGRLEKSRGSPRQRRLVRAISRSTLSKLRGFAHHPAIAEALLGVSGCRIPRILANSAHGPQKVLFLLCNL